MKVYFRNLIPDGFELTEGVRLIPPCNCWTRRPRWLVQRRFFFWWRCVDCGRYARKARD